MNKLPDFKEEKKLWKQNYKIVAGLDEVGRGCLAGSVITACVVFKPDTIISNIYINDSKKLTQKQREKAEIWIKQNALSYGIGSASVAEINRLGIVKATNKAFRRAIKNCKTRPDHILIDAFYIPYIKGIKKDHQKPIIKGDSKAISIAAASIIAKVYRDKLMTKLSQKNTYKPYNWDKNKGYGTLAHRLAIKTHGKTRLHRVSFLRKLN